MRQYLDLMQRILDEGVRKNDRTGTGTLSLFGAQMRFDLAHGFPLLTTKKLHVKSIIHELLWFLQGRHQRRLPARQRRDDLGRVGRRARRARAGLRLPVALVAGARWTHIDQISQVLAEIKRNPDSRRLLVSAWNVADIPKMKLAPCHAFFQFYVAQGRLSLQMYQRSADFFLGVPFNIASYALLALMVAQVCRLQPGEFVHTLGDTHLYLNHLEQAREQLTRQPRPLPRMRLNPAVTDLFAFRYEDFTLEGYEPHAAIKAPVAV